MLDVEALAPCDASFSRGSFDRVREVTMHEMSLIKPVVEIVLEQCKGRSVKAVKEVRLAIGEMHDVVDKYIPGLFRFLARGTVAECAEVVIRKIPMTVRCNGCGEIFRIDVRDESTWQCTRCGDRQNYHLYSGREFLIESIEVEAAVEPEPALACC